ncbi:MAG: response regulator [Acidobacteria bacterium]|nr:response regulator [Acidobacteriota bacterium]
MDPIERASPKTVRLALRWMLILATALILSPPGDMRLTAFDFGLVLSFVASNIALTCLPEGLFRSRNLEYLVVVADTFLVSLGLFRAGLEGGDLPLAFFLNLLLAALGTDLPRIMAGATVVSGFYLYLMRRHGAGEGELTSLLMRLPFLYTAALYYGHLVHQGRIEQAQFGRSERERMELKTFHEITTATTSTLDLREVFYLIVQRIALLVSARRCSVLTVDGKTGECSVLASSDNPGVSGLVLDLRKYPEVRKAIETRETVVINDVAREPLMQPMKEALDRLGYQSIMVLPILYKDTLLGMLFLRAARADRRFTREEITACQVVANASASAIKNALLYGQLRQDAHATVRGPDGGLRDVLVAASPLRDGTGAPCGTVGIIKDITDLKSARRSLQVTEKLSAMGELVSGVAHELNNPLTGVLGYAQLLMGGATDARQRKSVERIFESALRCQKIVQNLLAFARRYPSEKRYLGLNGIIEKTLDLKGYQLRVNNLKVVKNLDPLIPKTMLDFNQMQQVLLNLINNAEHAIAAHKGQGTLSLTTSARDGTIRLEVRDDGPGMPPEILARIFDPFFTTKEVGEGAGLGLSVSYGIIKDHGGRIWGESRKGDGTSIIIELPIVTDTAAAETASGPGRGQEIACRSLSILAVDDETVILDLIVDAFGRDGRHSIDTAGSAREALQKIERRNYDILLLDLKMPEMDGQQLFEEIRRRWPDLARRVIFASGDTLHPVAREFLDHSGCPCVDKPFKLEHLASTIASLAGGAASHPQSAAGA